MKIKKNDRLQTPEWVYSRLGKIDLDPCAGVDTSIGSVNWAMSAARAARATWAAEAAADPGVKPKIKNYALELIRSYDND